MFELREKRENSIIREKTYSDKDIDFCDIYDCSCNETLSENSVCISRLSNASTIIYHHY